MTKNRRSLWMLAFIVVASGCGKNPLLTEPHLKTYEQNGDQYLEFGALIQSPFAGLPEFEKPLTNPQNPSQVYGKISIKEASPKGHQLVITGNMDAIGQGYTGPATLPNGRDLPVQNLEPGDVIALAVPSTLAQIYFGVTEQATIIGFAVPIKEFDTIGNFAPNLNLFPAFTDPKTGIGGVGGIFTGKESGQSGLAFFVDFGPLNPSAMKEDSLTYLVEQKPSIRNQTRVFRKLAPLYGKELHLH